jgi:multiple sugar transport system permease protein
MPPYRAAARRPRRLASTVLALLILAVMLFPVYWMVNSSLQPSATSFTTSWLPVHLGLSGYRQALSTQGGHLVTSIVIALAATAIAIAVAAPAAYALARFPSRSARPVLMTTLVTQMIPGIVIANALYQTYNSLHLLNSIPGLMLADASLGIPFSILLMRSFMAGIPGEIIEAARVDGANALRVFLSVVVPVSRNGIITAALFSFLFAWSDFVFALTLTSANTVTPVTLGIYQFLGSDVKQWTPVMATAVLASIPAAALLVVAQRYIASGVTGGAVK